MNNNAACIVPGPLTSRLYQGTVNLAATSKTLTETMSGQSKYVFRCYAEGCEDAWEAICLDLDIAVQGDSFADVQRSLNDAIAMYVERALELPESDRARLLEQDGAPLGVRLRYAWKVLKTALIKGPVQETQQAFTVALAA